MKKLFILASAALVLAACNNDVKIDENTAPVGSNAQKEIAFTAFSTPAKHVRSNAPVEGATFDNGTSMYVSAWDVVTASGRNYFSNKEFAKGENNTWVSAGVYWPLSPTTINFLAYANLTAGSAVWDTDAAKEVVLTMGDNSATQNDLMYAIGTGTVVQNPDNTLTFPTSVPMVFKHAQAWIQFKVKAQDATIASALTINSITLNQVSCEGICTVTQTNYDAASYQSVAAVWSDYTSHKDDIAAVAAAGYSSLSASLQEYANLMVIPDQGITGFTINYTLDSKAYDYTYTLTSATLEQAKKYIYAINFNLHQIEIAPSVEAWDAETPVNVEVPNSKVYTYAEGAVAGTYSVAAAEGTYYCTITGLTAGATYNLTEEPAADWLTEVASVVADPNGKANIYFTVTENNSGDVRNANIVLTNSEVPANTTKVTVSQALPEP